MIEAEAKHVQEQEREILKTQAKLLKRGQWFAFLIAVSSMGGAIYAVKFSTAIAGVMVTVGVGTLAVAFLGMARRTAKQPQDDARERKE